MNTQKKLLEIIAKIKNPCLVQVCRELVTPSLPTPFTLWPASMSYHHAHTGGLIEHTLEVCQIAMALANSTALRALDLDVVLTACLWHDYGKVEKYVLRTQSDGTERQRVCKAWDGAFWVKRDGTPDKGHPHIELSVKYFVEAINRAGRNVKDSVVEHIIDCILSHHGRVEWGSPFEPKTAEAILIHQADMLSAKIGKSK